MSAPVSRQNQPATTSPPTPARQVSGGVEVPIESHRCGEVVIVRPLGQLDRTSVEHVYDAADAHKRSPVVIDLSDCILADPNALAGLPGHAEGVELCFVSRRLSCRRLLARSGLTSRFAVFQQLEDAMQARTLANAGYGNGWRNP